MRLLTFSSASGPRVGVVISSPAGDGVLDLTERLGVPSLKKFLSSVDPLLVARVVEEARAGGPDHPLAGLELLPVIPDPDKILCIGVNYRDHAAEMGRALPEHPTVFLRLPASQVGHGQPLVRPRVSAMLDYEGELAVVIGRGGRHIAPGAALEHVAGYAIYQDGSVRDWQRHTSQFTPGKNFVATGGFGPFLTTRDEVPDVTALELVTRVNGEQRQRARTSELLFDIPSLIAYVSTFTPLVPGDVLVTGTPAGVGAARVPPAFLAAGDVVSVSITGLGELVHPVVDEPQPTAPAD